MASDSEVQAYVYPEPSLFDETVSIQIKRLPTCCVFTLHASTLVGQNSFQCLAVYCSDENGEIDLNTSPSIGGFYKGIKPMGLLWAMTCSTNNQKPMRLIKREVTTPLVVTISIYENRRETLEELQKDDSNQIILRFKVTRHYMSPGVKRIEIKEDSLQGTLFVPPGQGPFPGLINLFGGIPGTLEFKAALFASHGFATLALPYFGIEGLPDHWFNLKMEYFQRAVQFMCNHCSVIGKAGIGIVGVCKGGQIALCMADCIQGVRCVVAVNCAVYSAHNHHMYGSQMWPAVLGNFETSIEKSGARVTRNCFHYFTPDKEEFTSSIFRFYQRPHIGIMYIASLDDGNVPSEYFANTAEILLKRERHPNYVILRYPGAGHLLEPPYVPHCEYGVFGDFGLAHWGGSPLLHCRAQEDAWTKQLNFLRKNFRKSFAQSKM
ncbi:unnamed protein product [Clavelina lepadiformis]|uniref:Uncharacterized protein n=1 Tax=Clavelina lepadiformis TaxID=159417 RepID=A0ABP0FSS9_CLALP